MSGLRLNLGCGLNRLDGFINVDRFGEPDVRHDLESFPWPWADDSVDEIVMNHVLEHLGRDTDTFLGIIKELYRVCRHGAMIRIVVPHHRHEFFYNDPTHVRAVTPGVLTLFSQRLNRIWAAQGIANSPLGLYLNVDFELVQTQLQPGEIWRQLNAENPAKAQELIQNSALYNNVFEQVGMLLRPLKPPGTPLE